jgi:hypothetical protein
VHTQVTVREGHFSVLLGDRTPIPPTLFQSSARFIGVTVDPYDEMVPRQRFATVPYAFNSAMLNGRHAHEFADAGHKHNTLSSPNGVHDKAVYVDDNGHVGIGIQAPQAMLHVIGAENNGTDASVKIQSGPATLLLDGDEIDGNSGLFLNSNVNKNVVIASGGGNVGIGQTPASNAKLDVAGNVRVRGSAPILIKRFTNQGNDAYIDTGVSGTNYDCVIGGVLTKLDIKEGSLGIFAIWAHLGANGNWWARVEFHSDAPHENPDIDVLCFRRELTEYSGVRTSNIPDSTN